MIKTKERGKCIWEDDYGEKDEEDSLKDLRTREKRKSTNTTEKKH